MTSTRRGVPRPPSALDAAHRRHSRRRRLVAAAVVASLALLVLGQAGVLPLAPLRDALGGLERAITGSSGQDLRAVTAERDALALARRADAAATSAAAEIDAARRLDPLAGARLVPARVIAWSRGAAAGDRRVTLDAGAGDGVQPGAAVVTGDGLVGRTVAVNRWTSDVVLLGDPTVTVSVRVGTPGALAAVSTGRLGRPESSSRLTVTAMVPGTLHPGDAVVTTGGGPYPVGLRVGTVGSLDPASGQVAASAALTPAVDPATLSVVSVLVAAPRTTPRPAVTATPTAGPTAAATPTTPAPAATPTTPAPAETRSPAPRSSAPARTPAR